MTQHADTSDAPDGCGGLPAVYRAIDALKVQNAITGLATRYDARLVVKVAREWVEHMERQIAQIDRTGAPK